MFVRATNFCLLPEEQVRESTISACLLQNCCKRKECRIPLSREEGIKKWPGHGTPLKNGILVQSWSCISLHYSLRLVSALTVISLPAGTNHARVPVVPEFLSRYHTCGYGFVNHRPD